jgi:hypothetical protein
MKVLYSLCDLEYQMHSIPSFETLLTTITQSGFSASHIRQTVSPTEKDISLIKTN